MMEEAILTLGRVFNGVLLLWIISRDCWPLQYLCKRKMEEYDILLLFGVFAFLPTLLTRITGIQMWCAMLVSSGVMTVLLALSIRANKRHAYSSSKT